MSTRFFQALVILSLLLNVLQLSWTTERAQSGEPARTVPSKTNAPAPGLDGDVIVRTTRMQGGEELIQIIDSTRNVVCYGKISAGGSSSVSCQKSK